VFAQPEEAVHHLPHQHSRRHFREAIGVLELVEEFSVADVLHLYLGLGVLGEVVFRVVYCTVGVVAHHSN